VLIKTLLYTGVRVSELVAIRLGDVDFDRCQIRINEGKGREDRVVPFPPGFKETLALHAEGLRQKGASHLFESTWKKPYSDRGYDGSWSVTPQPPAWLIRSHLTDCDTSC
jgi:integrase/recombinase XerD